MKFCKMRLWQWRPRQKCPHFGTYVLLFSFICVSYVGNRCVSYMCFSYVGQAEFESTSGILPQGSEPWGPMRLRRGTTTSSWFKSCFSWNNGIIYWLVVWNIWIIFPFSIQLGIIIRTDLHIFQRGRYTTNQFKYTNGCDLSMQMAVVKPQ